jgi:predicted transcriptional regulator
MERAAKADEAVLALLKDKPMTTGEIKQATGAKPTTLQVRLARLAQRGVVAHGEDGTWSATPPQ